jgi:hypothetical protein
MRTRIIKNCSNEIEANIILGSLHSEGIDGYIQNHINSALFPTDFGSMSGVSIVVNEKDVLNAIRILKRIDNENKENESKTKISCPYCYSNNIAERKPLNKIVEFILSFLTYGRYTIYYGRYKCKDCGANIPQ